MTPPVDGAALRAALDANCLRGALPPVDLPVHVVLVMFWCGKLVMVRVRLETRWGNNKVPNCDDDEVAVMTYGLSAWYEPLLMTSIDIWTKLWSRI